MKTKNKTIAMLEIAIVLCSVFLVALPGIAADQNVQQEMQKVSANTITTASEDDYVLGVYGNANEDDTIDMGDVVYTKLAIFGKKAKTELCDAKYDGRINVLDVIQTKLIILGKEKELTVIDTVDRIVTVKKPIKRIVVINRNILETMRSIDATDKIVGVGKQTKDDKAFFPVFSEYPCIGSWGSPDIEKILELRPDVVTLWATLSPSKQEGTQNKLEASNPDITVIRFDCFKPDWYIEEVRKLGYILDKKEEAEEFIDFYQSCKGTITERVEGISEEDRPKVYIERKHYRTDGVGRAMHQMVVTAGGNNIFSDLSGYADIDPEEVIKRDPEIIVYVISDSVYRGARDIVGIRYLAKWFHPELFKDLDPKAIHQEYLTRFQGLDIDLDKKGVFVYPEPS
jgi:iron complex transport system substrate-binding protein